MTVPDFDQHQVPEPAAIGFRFLGRDWSALPELPEAAIVVASIANSVGAYAESWPDVYAAVLADLAVRFVGYAVTEPEEWATAVRLNLPDTASVLTVMTWLSEQYTTQAAAPTPARTPAAAPSRRTDLDGLRHALDAAGVRGNVIRET
ncbi:MAG TPA: hypothetical protein VGE43_19370 [Acidimicrobiales bacterium]